jgi:hypothetical protein
MPPRPVPRRGGGPNTARCSGRFGTVPQLRASISSRSGQALDPDGQTGVSASPGGFPISAEATDHWVDGLILAV